MSGSSAMPTTIAATYTLAREHRHGRSGAGMPAAANRTIVSALSPAEPNSATTAGPGHIPVSPQPAPKSTPPASSLPSITLFDGML
eukprot:365052-Chlamydomonas_euryale.AAC.12